MARPPGASRADRDAMEGQQGDLSPIAAVAGGDLNKPRKGGQPRRHLDSSPVRAQQGPCRPCPASWHRHRGEERVWVVRAAEFAAICSRAIIIKVAPSGFEIQREQDPEPSILNPAK